jgi:hypothetical protein
MRASWGARFVTRGPAPGNVASRQRVSAGGGALSEERHGFAGTLPSAGGLGAMSGPPRETIRHGFAGTLPSTGGVWGAMSGPPIR